MAKVKISKKLKKGKTKFKTIIGNKSTQKQTNTFKEKYFEFYDDIKTPTKRYDW